MKLEKIKSFEGLKKHRRLREEWNYSMALLLAIETKKGLSEASENFINKEVLSFNQQKHTVKSAIKELGNLQSNILRQLKEQDGLRLPDYYQNHYMALGALFLGIPLGLLIAYAFSNLSLALVGFPVGMICGALFGRRKDKVEKAQGNHLDVQAALDLL